MRKEELRLHFQKLRNSLTETDIQNGSHAIARGALNLPIWHADVFHIFLSISEKKEVNTRFLISLLQERGKQLVVPRMAPGRTLEHYPLTPETRLELNTWGIPEPSGGTPVSPENPEVIFIPLLAFDLQGYRVGYGGGYYDRFLEQARPSAIRVGLSLFGPVEDIEGLHPGDVPMDYCITPEKVYAFA